MFARMIIGNVIMLMSSLIMVLSGFIKKKEKIIIWQTIQIGMACIGNLVLNSYAGAIDNFIGCVRNLLCYKEKLTVFVKIIIVSLYTVLSIAFNNVGWIGVLLWIGSIIYIFLMDIKNVVQFKILIIFTMLIWTIHDLLVGSYVAFIFDIGTIVANLISIWKLKKH